MTTNTINDTDSSGETVSPENKAVSTISEKSKIIANKSSKAVNEQGKKAFIKSKDNAHIFIQKLTSEICNPKSKAVLQVEKNLLKLNKLQRQERLRLNQSKETQLLINSSKKVNIPYFKKEV